MASPTQHAYLAPSAAHRWLNCTPSAVLEKAEPSTPSIYAEEGTEAHALAEIKLQFALGKFTTGQYELHFENFRLKSKYYNAEFNEYVNRYIDEVMTIVTEDYKGHDVKVYLEEFVTFHDIVPEGGGTSDVVIVGKNFIHIIDLKFGRGVPVSAVGNPQLRLYALGAIRKHLSDCVCTEVKMTIIQPRLDDMSTDFMATAELNDWAKNYVKPRAELAIAGQGELVAGDHCKFCKCRGKCQKLADTQLAIAQSEFDDIVVENHILEPSNMSPEMLSKVLTIAPAFIDWFKEVQGYALKEALFAELKIPGYKVVEGRSVRTIFDKDSVIEKLKTAGFSEEDYMKPQELLGITALERNIGKKLFASLCGNYITKPAGKLTLVPLSDRREAIDTKALKLTGDEFQDDAIETDDQ